MSMPPEPTGDDWMRMYALLGALYSVRVDAGGSPHQVFGARAEEAWQKAVRERQQWIYREVMGHPMSRREETA